MRGKISLNPKLIVVRRLGVALFITFARLPSLLIYRGHGPTAPIVVASGASGRWHCFSLCSLIGIPVHEHLRRVPLLGSEHLLDQASCGIENARI
jgi:hypothetical protein